MTRPRIPRDRDRHRRRRRLRTSSHTTGRRRRPRSPTPPSLLLVAVALTFLLVVAVAVDDNDNDDRNENCAFWANEGECESNPRYMLTNCAASCRRGTGGDDDDDDDDDEEEFDDHDEEDEDGGGFDLEEVRRRSAGSDETTWRPPADDAASEECPLYPPVVKLPEGYRPEIRLGEIDESKSDWTLDDLLRSTSSSEDDDDHPFRHFEYMKPPANFQKSAASKGGQTGVAAKFINFRKRKFDIYWDDPGSPGKGVYNGYLDSPLGARKSSNTYVGHAFKFYDAETGELYKRLVMRGDKHLYVFEPDEDDRLRTRSSRVYRDVKQEQRFMARYFEANGTPWLSKYGRPSPALNMWPANRVGQTHTVVSNHPYWTCDDTNPNSACRGSGTVSLNLTVVSRPPHGPRVFVIENLMSDAECDHVLSLGKHVVGESMVGTQGGGFRSSSRTSSTGWLRRSRTEILKTIHWRFADVLGLDESILRTSAEDLQVVRYEEGQQYNNHHDFGDNGRVNQRFLTLLIYIRVPERGGHTSFPKAYDGRGMRLKPSKRGGAVLFYSMLPDGNGDDLSLHSGETVMEGAGEKWVCNLWIWDPTR